MNQLKAQCPVCVGELNLPENTEVSEVITCVDCKSRLVVAKIENGQVDLTQAPEVEEDWGE